ncbi:hypothetical protein OUZ56_012526 [Daphnia magna]|uniref:DUF4806 domain-containing protein n=1 Tax=Daphnia magna TaxID=35525 RepID=A0ABQ9Z3A3_9CRUS|nr:hypothetical protein OUZ56_012526 [Daphnia magna]
MRKRMDKKLNNNNEQNESKENEVVPSTWFYGGKCSLPSKNHRRLAEACSILKMSWKRHDCKIVSSHDSYEKAIRRKHDTDTSESAEFFWSNSSKNMRSEGSKRIRTLRNQDSEQPSKSSLQTSADFEESDDIAVSQDMFQPAGIDSAESESGMDEESGVTAAINAGLLTQPAARTVCGPMTESSQMTSYGDRSTSQPGTSGSQNANASSRAKFQALMSPSTSQETNGAHLKRKTTLLGLHQKRLSFERQVLRHFSNQNRYLRVMAREKADIKAEQRDLRRLLLSKQSSGSIDPNNGDYRHPVFQKHVEMLRSFFEKNVEHTVRRIWREVMSNELMQAYTWSGTPKPNSGKEKGLAVKGSRLLYAVTEAVKHGEFGNTSILRIEQISQVFIRKAVDRLKNSLQKK